MIVAQFIDYSAAHRVLCGELGIAAGGLVGSIIAATVGAVILLAPIRLIKRA